MRGRLAARGIAAEAVDSYRYAAPLFSHAVSEAYIGMVRVAPRLYGVLYRRAERARKAGGVRVRAATFAARNLRGLVERMRPRAVVCTHAFPCNVMAAYKRLFGQAPPVVGVVTDFAIHPFWIYREIDAYAVATSELRSTLLASGIAPSRVGVDGIPIDPRFGVAPACRAALRERLGLPVDANVVLVMGGGLGLGPVAATVRALAATRVPVVAVVIAGTNRRLARRVAQEAARRGQRVRVLEFVDDVHDWMHAADLLVTKPGGLTTSEALAAGTPMVLLRPLPGQEERNADYLLSRGAAVGPVRPAALAAAVDTMLSDASAARRVTSAAAALARPCAAERIARRIIALAEDASRADREHAAGVRTEGTRHVERWPSG